VSVLFRNSQEAVDILPGSVEALAQFVLRREGASEKEVSILFVDDRRISELNARHLAREGPTDVLAFPMSNPGDASLHPEIIGDVVVSAERALSYAREHRVRVDKELSLYLIHGLLHLLGYDDVKPADERKMRKRQRELLREADKERLLLKTR